MKKEKSCGAIVYKIENRKIYYLLIKSIYGNWGFPKGHVEDEETEVETSIREVKEETNLDVEIDTSFRKQITYSPMENTIKDVVFFLAVPISNNLIPQKTEIKEVHWLEINEAFEKLIFDNDKQMLESADKHVKSHYFTI